MVWVRVKGFHSLVSLFSGLASSFLSNKGLSFFSRICPVFLQNDFGVSSCLCLFPVYFPDLWKYMIPGFFVYICCCLPVRHCANIVGQKIHFFNLKMQMWDPKHKEIEFLLQTQDSSDKGNVNIISNVPSFKDYSFLFTTVPLKPLSNQ